MAFSLLGQSGVKVSKICLGTATFGVAPDARKLAGYLRQTAAPEARQHRGIKHVFS
jgi:aryl-alcohol dehydrogenase-like predicted oxidoreductase